VEDELILGDVARRKEAIAHRGTDKANAHGGEVEGRPAKKLGWSLWSRGVSDMDVCGGRAGIIMGS
jgi:hypothetical protein